VGGESDRLIVLRARESRVHGEGAGEVTQPTKETSHRQVELIHEANLPVGNSEETMCKASHFEEPGAGNPHAGICTGAVG
jgi:hypothetical protein